MTENFNSSHYVTAKNRSNARALDWISSFGIAEALKFLVKLFSKSLWVWAKPTVFIF